MNTSALILSSVLVVILIGYGFWASKKDANERKAYALPLIIGMLATFPLGIITMVKSSSQIPALVISYIGAILLSIVPTIFHLFAIGDTFLYLIGANVFAVSSTIKNENYVNLYLIGMVASFLFEIVYICANYEKRKKQGESEENIIKEGVAFFPAITFGNIVTVILIAIRILREGVI